MASVETEEHPEAGEEGSRRNPIVVMVVALLLVAVAAIAWWSQRERLVSVPDVVGQNVDGETLEPVRTLLQSRELVIGEISDGECGVLFVPDTVVVSQAPAAGEEVPFGTQVDLVLCRDRGPSRSPLGQVPDSIREAPRRASTLATCAPTPRRSKSSPPRRWTSCLGGSMTGSRTSRS